MGDGSAEMSAMPVHFDHDTAERGPRLRPWAPAGGDAAIVPALPASEKSGNLQCLRALAASLVVVHHLAIYGQLARGAARPFPGLDAAMGAWGVYIFFALSGFLMAGLVLRDSPDVFLASRIGRIVPTYLAVVALFFALSTGLGLEFGGISVLALSLAPVGPRSYPLAVEWTLVYEMAFYVGLFLVAVAGLARRLVPLTLGWVAVLAAATLLLPPGSAHVVPPPAYLLPLSAPCLPFAGGLLLPTLISRGWVRPASALLALPLAFACLWVDAVSGCWLGGIAAVLVVGAAATAPPVRRQGPVVKGLLALGDWSYVLYLVHAPILLLASRLCPPHWSALAYGAVSVGGALAATALIGPLDVAFHRHLRGWISGLRPVRLRQGLTVFLMIFAGCAVWGSGETARNDLAEARARRILAKLPAETWTSPAQAEGVIAGLNRGLPSSLRGAVEDVARPNPAEWLVRGFAFDPDQPDRRLHLAVFCGGRLVALDRPRRVRRDLADAPGYERLGRRRIGYSVHVPADACAVGPMIAVIVDSSGRMAPLAVPQG